MYLDHRFHINGNGCMYTDPQHGYEYNLVKQLYQGLTRAREHITLVVIGNRQLYKRLTEMLCPPKNKPQPAEDAAGSGTAK